MNDSSTYARGARRYLPAIVFIIAILHLFSTPVRGHLPLDTTVRWQPLDPMHGGSNGIRPITRADHIVARHALVAHSSDSARPWRGSQAWGVPLASVARDGHVVIGWSGRVITRSTDAGLTWSEAVANGIDMPELVQDILAIDFVKGGDEVDELLAVVRFAEDSAGYFGTIRSTDGGATWKEDAALPWLDAFLIARDVGPLRLQFASGGSGRRGMISGWGLPLVTDDGGRTWLGYGPAKLSSLVMADADHAFGCYYSRGDTINIFSTFDGGKTWERRYTRYMSKLLGIDALSLNDYRILCTNDELRSTDGGLTWDISYHAEGAGRPKGGKVHRLDSLRLYVLDGSLWYYSSDGGRTYTTFSPFPAGYESMVSSRDDEYIYIPGSGNRVERWRLGDWIGAVPEDAGDATRGMLLENLVHGNRAMLRLDLELPAMVGVTIVDMLGRPVASRSEARLEAGGHALAIGLDGLASGRYLVTLRIDDAVETHPLVVVR